jgi:hypothetical protein
MRPQPHTYTSIKALESIGRLYPNGTVLNNVTSTDFSAIPSGQLGLNQSELPPQIPEAVGPNSQLFADNVAEIQAGKPWWQGKFSPFEIRQDDWDTNHGCSSLNSFGY